MGGKRDSHHSDWLSDALAAKHTCARKYVHTHIRTCAHSTHLVAPPPPLPNATLDLSTAIDSAEPPHTRTHTRRERERERELKKNLFLSLPVLQPLTARGRQKVYSRPGPQFVLPLLPPSSSIKRRKWNMQIKGQNQRGQETRFGSLCRLRARRNTLA